MLQMKSIREILTPHYADMLTIDNAHSLHSSRRMKKKKLKKKNIQQISKELYDSSLYILLPNILMIFQFHKIHLWNRIRSEAESRARSIHLRFIDCTVRYIHNIALAYYIYKFRIVFGCCYFI